ncbi:hypothetical protein OF83DRAFT_660758 [Amylostereum chailletii]|nr:hypothetical protein OF83DRAFT_660758 [Amylostereum chailletii]
MRWDTGPRHPPPAFSNSILIRAMVDSLGRTLRKLVLYRIALGLFPADHLSEFTSSLARLETIVSPALYLPNYANHNIDRIPLPNQLSCCRYLNIGGAPFVLPVDIAPTHVHRPRPTILSSILTPSLTHLSIHLSSNIPDAYANFSTAAPNLVSLTLVGYLATVTRFLTVHTFPPLQILLIDYIYYGDDGVAEVVPWLEALANVRAVRVIRVPDRELWALLRMHVEEDSDVHARFSALKTCGFVLQDGDGIPVFEDRRMGIAS